YITVILNPETVLIDSVVYAMIYADISFLLSPGLYRITGTEFSLGTFEMIGNIETQVIDTTLVMACDIETLTGDEFFGTWPNITNSLGLEMITAKYMLPLDFLMTDFSKPSLQNIDQYIIEPFTNILPEISDLGFAISGGSTTFTCTYFDENGHFPIVAEIEIEGSIYPIFPTSFDYSIPVEFITEIPLTNWAEATFRFSDNAYEFVEETIINTTGIENDQLSVSDFQLKNYPNPFNPATTISFNLTAEDTEDAEILIYNLKGQKIRQYSIFNFQSSIVWDGSDENNQPVSSGIYFYKLKADNYWKVRKMILLK
ncbi:MAG: T9SS type A sorting domain-containing protein, partial [Candidatus Cloacimonetes bacterium]|nr:T9SS type A sorting domain-containing protein [Candidatus Cloacimonadota bacterium]